MSEVILNNKVINLSGSISYELDDYEKKVIAIIKDFYNGKKEYILKTSGSTGVPKELKFSIEQIMTSVNMTSSYFGLSKKSKLFSCLSIDHVAGFMMLMRALVLDCDINIVSPSSNPFENIEEQNFDFSAFVPLHFYELFDKYPNKIKQFDKIKKIIIGGASIPLSLEKKILSTFSNDIYATYGMTETLTHIAVRKLKSNYFDPLNDVYLTKDDRNCLVISSPVLNCETIITNDLVEIKENKSFKIIGRIDNVINSGGIKIQSENVELGVEKLFFELDINKNFFVSSIEDDKFGNIVVLVIESYFEQNILDLINFKLKNYLSKYEIPKKVFFVDSFQRTLLGKIDKIKTLEKIQY